MSTTAGGPFARSEASDRRHESAQSSTRHRTSGRQDCQAHRQQCQGRRGGIGRPGHAQLSCSARCDIPRLHARPSSSRATPTTRRTCPMAVVVKIRTGSAPIPLPIASPRIGKPASRATVARWPAAVARRSARCLSCLARSDSTAATTSASPHPVRWLRWAPAISRACHLGQSVRVPSRPVRATRDTDNPGVVRGGRSSAVPHTDR